MVDFKLFVLVSLITIFLNISSSQELFAEQTMVDPIDVAALGRVAKIGDLYDARTDQFLHISMTKNKLPATVVQTIENKHSNIKYLKLNTLEEKLSSLNIQAELKLSVLFGLIHIGGSGTFLSDKKQSSKSVQVSLVASTLTEVERVDFTNEDEQKLIDVDVLQEIDATHVVVGIQWGGNVVISVEDSNYGESDHQIIADGLSAKLKMLVASPSDSVAINGTLSKEMNKYGFEIYGDILPVERPITTVVDAVALMKTSTKLLTEGNLGKGKAMSYTLLPLALFRQLLGVETRFHSILKSINEITVNSCVKWFDEMNVAERKVSDLLSEHKKYQHYIAKEKLDKIVMLSENFDNYRFQVKTSLAKRLVNIRSGTETIDQLTNLLNEANNNELSPKKIDFEQFLNVQMEFKFLRLLSDLQVKILDKQTSFQEFSLMHFNKNIYAFFYSVGFPMLSEEPLAAFRSILDKRETFDSNGIFVAIKIDVLSEAERQMYFNFVEPTRLRMYKNNDCIIDNYLINTNVGSTKESEFWSLDYMKSQLLNINSQLANVNSRLVHTHTQLVNVESQLVNITNDFVPIGYVYVQYPNTPDPTILWPFVFWREITSQYAGLFFRAEGGSSFNFGGGAQTDSSPRVTMAEHCSVDCQNDINQSIFFSYTSGTHLSLWLGSGGVGGGWTGIRFQTQHNEVIPRNMAIRIWQRV